MNVAATEQHFARRHADYAPPDEQPLQLPCRGPIGARIEERHDDRTVGDVEIDIAGSESLAGAAGPRVGARHDAGRLALSQGERPGHRQTSDRQASSTGVARIAQPLPGIARNPILRVAAALRPGEACLPGPYETREIVDVAAGLVVENSAAQPDDAADAKVFAQLQFHRGAIESGVAVAVEQALFRHQRGPLPVDVDGAALVDERRAIALEPLDLEDLGRDQ